jgi:hypothetical protein
MAATTARREPVYIEEPGIARWLFGSSDLGGAVFDRRAREPAAAESPPAGPAP